MAASFGQWIPLKVSKADRVSASGPRESLEARYGNHAGYVKAVAKTARKLQRHRLLLEEDMQRYIEQAEANSVLR